MFDFLFKKKPTHIAMCASDVDAMYKDLIEIGRCAIEDRKKMDALEKENNELKEFIKTIK
jgi:cell division protein FtsB